MRKLGLVGCDSQSASQYRQIIVNGVLGRTAGPLAPEIAIENLSISDIRSMADAGELDALTDYLQAGIDQLVGAGCEVVALGCATGHVVFDRLSRRSPVPLVSMVEAVRREVLAQGYQRIVLLGALPTMRDAFFKGSLAKSRLLVLSPGGEQRAWLSHVISGELGQSVVRDETAELFVRLVADGAEHGVDAIVLACSELVLLADAVDLGLPVIDALQVHAHALVDAIMDGQGRA